MPIRRDLDSYIEPYNSPLLREQNTVYYRFDSIPSTLNIQGVVALSNDVEFGTSSTYLNNGSIQLDGMLGTPLGLSWSIQFWCKLETSSLTPLLAFDSDLPFGLSYSQLNNEIVLIYYVTPDNAVSIQKSINIPSGWHYISIERDVSTIRISVDYQSYIEFTNVYYPARIANIILGGPLLASQSRGQFKVQSFLLENKGVSTTYLDRDVELYRKYFDSFDVSNKLSDLFSLSLLNPDSRTGIYPVNSEFTYYSYIEGAYRIAPNPISSNSLDTLRGLRLVREDNAYTSHNYAIDCIFKLSSIQSSLVIFDNYNEIDYSGLSLIYDANQGYLKLNYYDSSFQIVDLDTVQISPDSIYRLTISIVDGKLVIYFNGSKIYENLTFSHKDSLLNYKFNHNKGAISNTSTILYIYKFNIYPITEDFLPYSYPITLKKNNSLTKDNFPFRLHLIDERVNSDKAIIQFFTSNIQIIAPGQTLSIPITQQYSTQDIRYKVEISIPNNSDLITSNITVVNSFVISAGITTYNLSIALASFNKSKAGTVFKVVLSNYSVSKEIVFVIENIPEFDINSLKGNGYLEGLFAYNEWVGWDNREAIGNGQYIANSLYEKSYKISNNNEALDISSTINNVRTIFLIYQELEQVDNRIYVGNDSYTFNGGQQGELIGDLIVSSNEWLLSNQKSGVYKQVKVSPDGQYLVRAREDTNEIEVCKKLTNWDTPASVLALNLQSPSSVISTSIDISANSDYCVLGFPNANAGEGVVQLWNLNTLTKELHLGSPVVQTTTGGFGNTVCISDDGLTLYISEIYSTTVHIYKKGTNWSATPNSSIIFSNPIIHLSAKDNYLLVTTTDRTIYLYEENVNLTWGLLRTYTGISCAFDKVSNDYYIYNDLVSVFQILNLNDIWFPIHSFITTGYTKLALYNQTLAIASVDNGIIKYYDNYNSVTPITLTSTLQDYGIYLSMGNDVLVTTDYESICDIYTSDSSAYGERVSKAYIDGALVPNNTSVPLDNVSILCFVTSLPINITKIGSGYSSAFGANSLNGLILGCIFYSNIFTDAQVSLYTDRIRRLLNIQEVALIE